MSIAKTAVIADDHELFLEGLTVLLERLGFTILATARDGEEALAAIEAHCPAVAILDASMPGLSGVKVIEAARSRKMNPDPRFLILTMFGHGHLAADARAAGAAGIVSKDDTASELETALSVTGSCDDEFFMSRTIRAEAEDYLNGEMGTLTGREREILGAIVRGATTKEIAGELGLSARTVDHHRERLMKKVGAKNTADVVRFAARTGMRLE